MVLEPSFGIASSCPSGSPPVIGSYVIDTEANEQHCHGLGSLG